MIEYVQGWNSPGHLKWEKMAFFQHQMVWGHYPATIRCRTLRLRLQPTTSKMPFMTLPGVRHWGFFSLFRCLFVKFCVVSGIKFGKDFRKIYWTLHQVGLPSVSLCWFWFHCPTQSRYKYKDLEELEIYQLETQLLVISKNLHVESERGTWWNIGCGRSSCAFETVGAELLFFFPHFLRIQLWWKYLMCKNAAKLFQLTFVWHTKLQIVVAAKTSNDAKGSFCRHIT